MQEKEHKTFSWLHCDRQHKFIYSIVPSLWTTNFSVAWIIGTAYRKLSMVGHGCHPGSDQHYQLLDNVQATAHLSGHLSEPIEIVILHTVNYLGY